MNPQIKRPAIRHRTYAGRVVYNRKVHKLTLRDVCRIVVTYAQDQEQEIAFAAFGICGTILVTWIQEMRKLNWWYLESTWTVFSSLWIYLMTPLLNALQVSLGDFLIGIGFLKPDRTKELDLDTGKPLNPDFSSVYWTSDAYINSWYASSRSLATRNVTQVAFPSIKYPILAPKKGAGRFTYGRKEFWHR